MHSSCLRVRQRVEHRSRENSQRHLNAAVSYIFLSMLLLSLHRCRFRPNQERRRVFTFICLRFVPVPACPFIPSLSIVEAFSPSDRYNLPWTRQEPNLYEWKQLGVDPFHRRVERQAMEVAGSSGSSHLQYQNVSMMNVRRSIESLDERHRTQQSINQATIFASHISFHASPSSASGKKISPFRRSHFTGADHRVPH